MEVGELLKRWRARRSLSLSGLADLAQVSKATISRWESNQSVPDVATLLPVLQVLKCSESEKIEALGRIGRPRAVRELEKIDRRSRINLSEIGAPVVSTGELLRAMRLRRRMTLSHLSAEIGVRESTLSQWENGKRLPSDEHLQLLRKVLRADESEIFAIRSGVFPQQSNLKTLDDFVESFENIQRRTWLFNQSTNILEWIAFAQNCWRMAQTTTWGTGLLRESYTALSAIAHAQDKHELSLYFAKKAIDIPTGMAPSLSLWHPGLFALYEVFDRMNNYPVPNIIKKFEEVYRTVDEKYQKFRVACELAVAYSDQKEKSQVTYWFDLASHIVEHSAKQFMHYEMNWYKAQSHLVAGQPELALKVFPNVRTIISSMVPPNEGVRAIAYSMVGDDNQVEKIMIEICKSSERSGAFNSYTERLKKIIEHRDYSNLYLKIWS